MKREFLGFFNPYHPHPFPPPSKGEGIPGFPEGNYLKFQQEISREIFPRDIFWKV
jgi:hypothetical protein